MTDRCGPGHNLGNGTDPSRHYSHFESPATLQPTFLATCTIHQVFLATQDIPYESFLVIGNTKDHATIITPGSDTRCALRVTTIAPPPQHLRRTAAPQRSTPPSLPYHTLGNSPMKSGATGVTS